VGWAYDRKIYGLWADYEMANSWIYLSGGLGWKQLSRDIWAFDATTNLTILAANAKATDSYVNVMLDDTSGQVTQIYVH
jgi:hypothetical protein